jgi:hypothetical protein
MPRLRPKHSLRAVPTQYPVAAKEILAHVRRTVANSADVMRGRGAVRTPDPCVIRAGRAGGLPHDSLTTDLYLGCLPPAQTCYGSCFAARTAYQRGFDFGLQRTYPSLNCCTDDKFGISMKAAPTMPNELRSREDGAGGCGT